jgi:serine/threonine-protein kinase
MTAGEQQTSCPKCGKSFPTTVRICPDDGTVLEHPTMASAPTGVVLDAKYRLDSMIAEGGMGSVYKATHVMLGKTVAIKLIKSAIVTSPEIVRRFQREARAATALNHPNIVSVYDLGQTADGTLYIAMEFIDGPSLKSVIQAGRGIPAPRTIAILRQVASALAVAHRANIIHRDLKPQNIMLAKGHDGAEQAKLVDFGIAKTFEEGTELTMAGHALGTPYYMSPEQIEGKPVDARSDLYALGIILYEMLVGEVPFADQSTPAVLVKQLKERPAAPSIKNPSVPPMLEAIALRCLEKDPALRFQSVDEFATALGEASASLANSEATPTLPMRARSATPPQAADDATLPRAAAVPRPSPMASAAPAAEASAMAAAKADKGTRPTVAGIPPPVPVRAQSKNSMAPLIVILLLFGGLAVGTYFWWARQQSGEATPTQTAQAEPPSSVPAMAAPAAPATPQPGSQSAAPDTAAKEPQPSVPPSGEPAASAKAAAPPSPPPPVERTPPAAKGIAPAVPPKPAGVTNSAGASAPPRAGAPPNVPSAPAPATANAPAAATAAVASPPQPAPVGIPENAAVYFGCSGAPDVCAALRSAVSNAFEKSGLRSVNAAARADIAIGATAEALQQKVDTQFGTTFATRTYSIELTGEAPRAGDDVAMPGASTVSFDPSVGRERLDEKARVIASDIVDRVRAYVKKKRGQ